MYIGNSAQGVFNLPTGGLAEQVLLQSASDSNRLALPAHPPKMNCLQYPSAGS